MTGSGSDDQRGRLLSRPRPSIGYPVQVVSAEQLQAAQAELAEAQAELRQVILAGRENDREQLAKATVTALRKQALHEGLEPGRVRRAGKDALVDMLVDTGATGVRKRLAAAQAAVDGCHEVITLVALPTDGEVTAEKLAAAHPPTEQQMAKARQDRQEATQRGEPVPPWPAWNDDTFRPALLAACCTNGMTAEDWRVFLGERTSSGEARGLWLACLAVNERERIADPLVIPKGSTQMLSSLLS